MTYHLILLTSRDIAILLQNPVSTFITLPVYSKFRDIAYMIVTKAFSASKNFFKKEKKSC